MNSNINNSGSTFLNLSLKTKVFLFTSLLCIALVSILTSSELSRWKTLSKNYTESKGLTLVRTISPLIQEHINSNNIDKLEKLAKSLASKEIMNNDIIYIQISDASRKKLVDFATEDKRDSIFFYYVPPSVVIEKPIVDIENDKDIGFLQIIFSNEFFLQQSSQVVNIALTCLFIGLFLAYYISTVVAKHIENPIAQIVNITKKMSEGNLKPDFDIENSKESRPLCESLANMASKLDASHNNILYQNKLLERKLFELSALKQINHSFTNIHEVDKVYIKLVDSVLSVLTGIQTCMLLEVDEGKNEFEYKVVKGLNADSIDEHKRVPIDSIMASKVYQTGESLIINEATPNIKGNEAGSAISSPTIDKSFYMPIIVKGKVVAILFGKNKLSGEDFSEEDLRLVEGIINETSIAIKTAITWQDLHRKVFELNTLHEIGKNLGNVLDINKLLEMILDHIARIFGGIRTSSIILYDEATDLLNVKLYKGENIAGHIKPIKSGEGIAGKVFQRGEPIIINDMLTRGNDSIDSGSSSICVPLKVKEKCLGVLSITDKISGDPFDKSDLDMIVTLASQISISLNNAKLYEDLEASYLSAVRALANSIDAKDAYTMGHSERVAKYSVEIGKKLNLNETELKNLYIGALLHDIGKIGISEAIINKTDKLTNEEYQEIKTHPSRGAMIIEPAKFLQEKVPLIKYHHERFDGKGVCTAYNYCHQRDFFAF